MTKYSKRDREMAARLCSMFACGYIWQAEFALGIDRWSPASELAHSAIDVAWSSLHFGDAAAEAEAMIRTGWTP